MYLFINKAIFYIFFMNDGRFMNYLLLLWNKFSHVIFWYNQNYLKHSFKIIIHRDIKSVKILPSSM